MEDSGVLVFSGELVTNLNYYIEAVTGCSHIIFLD